MADPLHQKPPESPKWNAYLRKIGWLGFLFFLVKGLLWLAILFGAAEWVKSW